MGNLPRKIFDLIILEGFLLRLLIFILNSSSIVSKIEGLFRTLILFSAPIVLFYLNYFILFYLNFPARVIFGL